jgi:hypothetical protein
MAMLLNCAHGEAGDAPVLAAALDDSPARCAMSRLPAFQCAADNADPCKFFFYEVYRDEDAFKAHQAARIIRAVPPLPRCGRARASRCTVFPDYK